MKFSSTISILSATGAMVAAYGGSSGGNVAIVEIAAGQVGGGMSGGSKSSAVAMAAAATGSAAMMMTTAAPAAAPMTHTVTVGGGTTLAYNPPQIMAAVGDVVEFMFMGKNHTATQSTFDKPCNKMAGGMDSNFHPNPMDMASAATTFNFTVKDTAPVWWYCRQKTPVVHCGKGMVFAVNPTVEKSFDAFKSMAIAMNGTNTTSTTAAAAAASSSVTLSVDNGAAASTSAAVATAPPAAMSTMLAPGWNTNPSACSCACFCGVAAFPAGSLDGVGSFGGMSGSLPAPW